MTSPPLTSADLLGTTGAQGLAFAVGHGTENDFVLLPDPRGEVELGPVLAARLADRRAGLGADGVIRVVRSSDLPEGAAALAEDPSAQWFMDYRNADGSLAQMCGNGVRVIAALLLDQGWVAPGVLDREGGLAIGTRAGVKRVRRALGPQGEAWFATDMGSWRLALPEAAATGADSRVLVPGLGDVPRPALSLDLGNPHTVVALASLEELAAADLSAPPAVEPLPLEGTNVELIVPAESGTMAESAATHTDGHAGAGASGTAADSFDGNPEVVGHLTMRVHERGSGETRSCGTGACAAVLAARTWGGADSPGRWIVDVPGGQLGVRVLPGQRVELSGPAVLVARGHLAPGWLGA